MLLSETEQTMKSSLLRTLDLYNQIPDSTFVVSLISYDSAFQTGNHIRKAS